MKRLMICIALMSSVSAFAGPIQDGTLLLISGKAVVAKNILDIALARNSIKGLAADLKKLEEKNDKLKTINTVCASKLIETSDEQLDNLEGRYVTDINNSLSRNYTDLKESVSKLEKAQSCEECDQEIKEEAIKKYQEKVNTALDNLKRNAVSVPSNVEAKISSLRICDYSDLFTFDDSKIFTKLKRWGVANYSASLSPSQVLSGEFNDTLDLIVRKTPITVKRTASLLRSESSSYKNGVVNINITYDDDIITGIDNVVHPEVKNVLDIIHRDR